MRHRIVLAVAIVAAGLAVSASQQPLTPPAIAERAARFKQQSIDAEAKGLSEPFTGVTTNGTVAPGLFAVRSTGVSTEPVRKAADAFLAALTAPQRAGTRFKMDDDEWRKWMNQDFYVRQGVSFKEMTESQRESAFGLLRAGLSAKGLKQTRDIMKLNHTLGELTGNDFDRYTEWHYHITVMGTPSATEPWGWQFDGHHAVINYFVLGDQVVMTPFFAGSEPVLATSGKYNGTVVLQDEQAAGLKMINALPEGLRQAATIGLAKTRNQNLTEAWKDNVVLDYAGATAADFPAAQQQQLLDLIGLYVANLADGHAKVRLDEVKRHLDQTRFAWIGETTPGSVFYYRIHSPVILIEFDHQTPANLRHLAKDPSVPNPQHIHVVVRTPNGNDYGKDLLRQHYAQHPHP
ncbi:MAG: hypothetical protein RJA55_461 [Acidobacteriota bacterium]|jgi:hypothetical protein